MPHTRPPPNHAVDQASKRRRTHPATSMADSSRHKLGNFKPIAAGTEAATDEASSFATFMQWAKGVGIQANGVEPVVIEGRGTGLITTRKVEKGELLVQVPQRAMIKAFTPGGKGGRNVVAGIARGTGKGDRAGEVEMLSPQAQLAATLSRLHDEGDEGYLACEKHWPSREDFEAFLLWLPADATIDGASGGTANERECDLQEFHDLLPGAVKKGLERLQQDLDRDLAAMQHHKRIPSTDQTTMRDAEMDEQTALNRYHWTLANTRSFAWKPTGTATGQMVMCPVLDFVNHVAFGSGEACEVSQSSEGYELHANRAYDSGEEIFASYGAHSNDKLLVHYGFTLPLSSVDDSISLDQLLLPHFTTAQRSILQDVGYSGNYSLAPSTGEVCFRTQVAVRSVLLSSDEWEFFMGSGDDVGADQSLAVVMWLKDRVLGYSPVLEEKRKRLRQLLQREERPAVKARLGLVEGRWGQIEDGLEEWVEVNDASL